MKKITFILSVLFLTSCAYNRIGSLTVVSTRNMDTHTDYVLIEKEVQGKARIKNHDAIEIAVEQAVRKHDQGEFMKNVKIYTNGRRVKVVGDVWGTQK